MSPQNDQYWMKKALQYAQKAALLGEVPVAALIVGPEGLISRAINNRERENNPLGHAELLAIHRASKSLKSWRLSDCTLYVTLEPCVMCAGAIQQARLGRVVYAAADPKAGAAGSLYNLLQDSRLNHQVEIKSGVLAEQATPLLQNFFQAKRAEKKALKENSIYRERSTVIVIHDGKILGFHGEDPHSKQSYFFLPGGALEDNETPFESAHRECLEETGYDVEIEVASELVREYGFHWNGKDYNCKTFFYLASLKDPTQSPRAVQDADYHRGVDWVSLKETLTVFSYQSDILWAVRKMMKRYQKKSALR